MLSIIKPAFILGLSLLTIIRNKERDYKKTIKNVIWLPNLKFRIPIL